MIEFKNMNKSIMSNYEPKWQAEVMQRVSAEFYEQALGVSAKFQAEVLETLNNCLPGYAGSEINSILKFTPRFTFIKNITGDDGTYDAEIDLLFHTVTFNKV